MSETSFVIVMPTRRRLGTFRWALETCLSQNYDNFKVVAMVNSCDETVAYLRELNDPRVQIEASETDLSMIDNWERFFELPTDSRSYVFFLGDDDGLLPGALACADRLIRNYRLKVLNWEKGEYGWPDIILPHLKNYAKITLGSEMKWWSSAQFLDNTHLLRIPYHFGPGIYSSFVRMELLSKIRGMTGNKFFHSASPDVYSCYAIAAVQDFYMRCRFSLSINGSSGHSTGANQIYNYSSAAAKKMRENVPIHPSLIYGPSVRLSETDSLLCARELIPQLAANHTFRYETLVAALADDAVHAPNAEMRAELLRTVSETCAKHGVEQPPHLRTAQGAEIRFNAPGIVYGFDARTSNLVTDLGRIGVGNVKEACDILGVMNPLDNVK